MKRMLRKRWLIFLAAGAIVSVLFWIGKGKTEANKIKNGNFYRLKRQNLKETVSLSGTIQAEEKVALRFQTSGRLAWIGVKEGDYVRKYQLLASLDQRTLQKNLKKKLNDYLKTRWDFEQGKDDYKNTIITDAIKRILEKNQFDLNNSVIDVELKDLALKYSRLFTPIEGVVTKIGAPYAGVNITPAQAEIQVVNPRSVYFSVLADQTDVVNLKKGLSGEIILDSYPDKKIKGVIRQISFTPKSGETGTVYEVKVAFDKNNSDYKYRLGMTGDFDFILKEKKGVLAVPLKYIKTEKNKKYVYKLKAAKPTKVPVQTGGEINNLIIIKRGLKVGDIIWQKKK